MRILLLIPLATLALAPTPPDKTARQGSRRRRSAQQSHQPASSQGRDLLRVSVISPQVLVSDPEFRSHFDSRSVVVKLSEGSHETWL